MLTIVILNSKFLRFIKVSARTGIIVQQEAGVLPRGVCRFDVEEPKKDKKGYLVRMCACEWYLGFPSYAKVRKGPCNQ